MMYNDETLDPLLFRIESWLDRWPWASRYYTNVLLPMLGVSSAAGILAVLALHVFVVALAVLLALPAFLLAIF
ncbi:MAG: hypothetical protein II822_09260 [Prevotella sp.]|nr:hypothetical protein [Prevotella sp.]